MNIQSLPVGSWPGDLPLLSQRIARLLPSPIRELSTHPHGRDDVIALWFGESDVPTDPGIVEAAAAALRAGQTFYTPNRGVLALREAIVAYGQAVYAKPPAIERITVTAGGMAALANSLLALLEPGDRVVVVNPVWPNITYMIRTLHARPEPLDLTPTDAGWRIDLDRLLEAVATRPRAVFVNSPNNPTGWVMPAEGMAALLAACRRHGVWLISDEVYHRVVFQGRSAPSILDIAEPDDAVVVINSLSKAWAMTGWRVGWAVHPEPLGIKLDALNEITVSGAATSFAQHGAVAAIRDGEDVIRAQQERCGAVRDLVVERLGRLGRVRMVPPDAAFYAFFGVDGMNDSLAFAKRLLEDTGVGLAPGVAFGPGGEGHLRLCFAAKPETIRTALDRLEPVLA